MMSCIFWSVNIVYLDFQWMGTKCMYLFFLAFWKPHDFERLWGWVNDRISILGWTVPLSVFVLSWLIMLEKNIENYLLSFLIFSKVVYDFFHLNTEVNLWIIYNVLASSKKKQKLYWKLKLWSSFTGTARKATSA